jgi:hypothetical protein
MRAVRDTRWAVGWTKKVGKSAKKKCVLTREGGIRAHQLRMHAGYMQASPDLAYGARMQSTSRLEENRRKN